MSCAMDIDVDLIGDKKCIHPSQPKKQYCYSTFKTFDAL